MFDKNILTFNPGWDNNGQNVDPFTDVREIQRRLKAQASPRSPKWTNPAPASAISSSSIPMAIR
ncbi:hypothetical protein [Arenimonas daejeonensis]|uniref:hypothetical protein n=1 Tax=Arenimonas daejeonensis TaxID=370777 RepID=UPI001D1536A2|nr:hypothetical protein [Arenimonas daejeonensis]